MNVERHVEVHYPVGYVADHMPLGTHPTPSKEIRAAIRAAEKEVARANAAKARAAKAGHDPEEWVSVDAKGSLPDIVKAPGCKALRGRVWAMAWKQIWELYLPKPRAKKAAKP
jgi:hypothetical protein